MHPGEGGGEVENVEEEREREEKAVRTKDLYHSQLKPGDLSKMFAPRGTQCYGIYASPWNLADQGCLLIV